MAEIQIIEISIRDHFLLKGMRFCNLLSRRYKPAQTRIPKITGNKYGCPGAAMRAIMAVAPPK